MKRKNKFKSTPILFVLITISLFFCGCESNKWKSLVNSFNNTFVDSANVKALLSGLGITLFLIFASLALGFIIGSLLSLLRYFFDNFLTKIINTIAYGFFYVPVSSWCLICYYLIFSTNSHNDLIALFALSISFSFRTYRAYTSSLSSVPQGQLDAAITMGYNKRVALRKIIIPQLYPNFLASISNETVDHIRDTSIVGYISVLDFQAVADAISSKTQEPFFPIILNALVYTLLCVLVAFLIKFINKKLFPKTIDASRLNSRITKGVKNDRNQ